MTKKVTCQKCWEKCKKGEYFCQCMSCGASFCKGCAAKELLWHGCECEDPCMIGHGYRCCDCREEYGYEYEHCDGWHVSKTDHDKYW